MQIKPFGMSGIMLLTPRRVQDGRGYFAETFRRDLFTRFCGNWDFVQENESCSVKQGTIRGLHFQIEPRVQGKLVRCTSGAIYDVAVDIRRGSPTFGRWIGQPLTAENGKQLWIPPGFAHGFCSLKPNTVVCYKVTSYFNSDCEKGLSWDDETIGVHWPGVPQSYTLSDKDLAQPKLKDLPDYFFWGGPLSCA